MTDKTELNDKELELVGGGVELPGKANALDPRGGPLQSSDPPAAWCQLTDDNWENNVPEIRNAGTYRLEYRIISPDQNFDGTPDPSA